MNKTSYFSLLCKRNIAIMFLSNMAIGLMDGPMRWLLPLLLMERGGPFLVGLSFSIANLGDTVIALLGGQFSDRFGRKIMLVISSFFYTIGSLLLFIAFWQGSLNFIIIGMIATIFIYGLSGISSGSTLALITESISEEDAGKALSLVSFGGLMGRILGSSFIGILFKTKPVEALIAMTVFSAISILLRLQLKETLQLKSMGENISLIEHLKGTINAVKMLGSLCILSIVALIILNGLSLAICGNYYSPYLTENFGLDSAKIGVIFSLLGLIQLLLTPVAGIVVDRYDYGFLNGLILGNVLSGAFLLVFSLTHLPFVAVLSMIISSGLGVFHSIGYDVMMAKILENRFRATIYSGMMAVWNMMFILGPVVGSILYSSNPKLTFIIASALLLVTFIPIGKIGYYFRNTALINK
ncbi:MFS transporter [Caldanaerobacter subterraneus]|uniref:MFS transporter n=1 Tax=Caldanaerobacter subterraneus TaxID=911092 RepID=A0A7Y2L5T2_9THEO|nr:MFS transporter [Caldanaerobacter subterraneus]NNG65805.1 MFS transporter [Caldanaerobacter subterraneus]